MDVRTDATVVPVTERLFAGGGVTGAILSAIDWSATPLGPLETWPQSLRTSLRICLTSRHPILLWWGPALVKLYNDAYGPILGQKHPWALGKAGREVWPEIWDVIGPMLESVVTTGQATWSDDQLLLLERNGFQEECYFTFSYSPIEDETGEVGGIFTAVNETTQRVLSERRGRLAREMAAAIADARSVADVAAQAARLLRTDPADVPVALLYHIEANQSAHLLQAVGLPPQTPLSPATVMLDDAADRWHLGQVVATNQALTVENIAWDGVPLAVGAELVPHTALVLPVTEPGQSAPTLVLVAGVSPRCVLDAAYQTFFTLLAGHLATAVAAAHAYETERQRAEALAEIDRAKTAFFSNVSHEFRTPLTLMLGPLTDLLEHDAELPPPAREQVQLVQRNSLRLLKLVNTLLDFTRIEAGRNQANYQPTDLVAYTADLASAFRSLIEKAGLRLHVDLTPLPEPVYVDHDMWEKVVLNLLSNAFKFTFQGEIAVSLHAEGRMAVLTVRDTGTGIPADEVPHVFERFHRVAGARSRSHEGSGIGLALVHELVVRHAGTITVASTEGEGTTFTVRVPLGTAHLPATPRAPQTSLASTALGAEAFVTEAERWLPVSMEDDHTAPPLPATTLVAPQTTVPEARILLADDNADMRDYLRRLLGAQYQVEAVADGAQALAAIQRDPPDLVLADVMMPVLDGFALVAQLRGDPRTAALPIMLLSARAGEEATIEGLARGADDYLTKPFSAREVLSRVAGRLEIARTRQAAERRTRQALQALMEAMDLLARDPHPEPTPVRLADALVALARDVLGCEIVSLLGVDDSTLAFTPLATLGRPPADEARWYADMGQYTLADYYAADEVARLRAGDVLVVDVAGYVQRGLPNFGTRMTLAVALRLGTSIRGVLSFAYHTDDHVFTATESELATSFAQMALVVLERERLLAERASAQAQVLALEETTRRMDEFLGIASHELRTPLTSVMANVQMGTRTIKDLQESATGNAVAAQGKVERLHLLLTRTDRQLERIDRLVNDLLDVSRITAGKLEPRLELCDVGVVTQEAVEALRAAWPERWIMFKAPKQALPVQADPDRIGQVVTNLLNNALKYSDRQESVVVTMRQAQGSVRVTVRDHGPGLTQEQQAQLFERFARVAAIPQQDGSGVGLGLGLYICKTIIERHGGQIGVASTPSKGSAFWFTLPLVLMNGATSNP